MIGYLLKYVAKCEPIFDAHIKDHLPKTTLRYLQSEEGKHLHGRIVSSCEVFARLLGYPHAYQTKAVMFLTTDMPPQRIRVVDVQAAKMAAAAKKATPVTADADVGWSGAGVQDTEGDSVPDSEVRMYDDKVTKYMNRPDDSEFDNITYPEYWRKYDVLTESRAPRMGADVCKDGSGRHVVLRKEPRIVRFHLKLPEKDGEAFWYQRVLLNVPFRSEDDLLSPENSAIGTDTQWKEEVFLRGIMKRDENGESLIRQMIEETENPYQKMALARKLKKLKSGHDRTSPQYHDLRDMAHMLGDSAAKPEGAYPDALPYADLTNCQKKACYHTIKKFASGEQCLVFLTGEAGTGKTAVVKTIVNAVRGSGKSVGVTATSGCAACLLKGQTLHKFAGFRVDLDLDKQGRQGQTNLAEVDFLVVDEISMMADDFFEALDEACRGCRKSNEPFGGLSILLVGDLCQLPPVLDRQEYLLGIEGSTDQKVPNKDDALPVWRHELWKLFQPFVLEENKRQEGDNDLADILSLLRVGKDLSDHQVELLRTRFQPYDQALETVKAKTHTAVCARNKVVDELNNHGLPDPTFRCRAVDTKGDGSDVISDRVRSYIRTKTNSPDEVCLSVGAPVMLLRNLNVEYGIVNGMRGTVAEIYPKMNMVRIHRVVPAPDGNMDDVYVGVESSYVGRITSAVGYKRLQIPLKLCFATTAHKCQGGTFERIMVVADNMSDNFGQFYTALSRVKSLDGLIITHTSLKTLDRSFIKVRTRVSCAVLAELERLADLTRKCSDPPEHFDPLAACSRGMAASFGAKHCSSQELSSGARRSLAKEVWPRRQSGPSSVNARNPGVKTSPVVRRSSRLSGDKYERSYWMTVEDICFVLCAVLGVNSVAEPTTWKVFQANVKSLYGDGGVALRPNSCLWAEGYLCQIINTDARGLGVHWLHAVAQLVPIAATVRVLDPMSAARSSTAVEKSLRTGFEESGHIFKFRSTGAQVAGDNSHCGHISTWYQILSCLALVEGTYDPDVVPAQPPDHWFDLVHQLLRIRDVVFKGGHAFNAVDYRTIGLAALFDDFMIGTCTMLQLSQHCCQYLAGLKEKIAESVAAQRNKNALSKHGFGRHKHRKHQ
jgi:hypothetical protein